MRKLFYLVLSLIFFSLGSAFAIDGTEDTNLLDGLRADENFSTLLSLLEQADLTESLSGTGPITLFAPDNAAFDELSEQGISLPTDAAELRPILLGHVLEGAYTVNDLQDAEEGSIASMQGEPLVLNLTAAGMTVNEVSLTATDVDNVFSNGVIHGVDGVIMPASMQTVEDQGDANNNDATPAETQTNENETATDETATDETTTTPAPVGNSTNLDNTSSVRIIHLAPNAPSVSVNFIPNSNDETTQSPETITDLGYEMVTEAVDVLADSYTVQLNSADITVLEQDMNFAPGISYTLAVIGLVLPEDTTTAEEDTTGFFDFIQNLFTNDNARDNLALRLISLEDNIDIAPAEGETLVRILHASPGTEAVDLVASPEGENNVVIGNIGYGEASNYAVVSDLSTPMAITIANSDAVALDLADANLEPNTVNTFFISGTSLEQAPLKVLKISSEPMMNPTALNTMPNVMNQTVATVVLSEPSLITLATALEEANMLSALDGSGPITLLAPSAEAFAELSQAQLDALLADQDSLSRILSNHVIEGAVYSDDGLEAGTVTSLAGNTLELNDNDGLQINNATITSPDIQASNGVIHIIDTLLIPEDMALPSTN